MGKQSTAPETSGVRQPNHLSSFSTRADSFDPLVLALRLEDDLAVHALTGYEHKQR